MSSDTAPSGLAVVCETMDRKHLIGGCLLRTVEVQCFIIELGVLIARATSHTMQAAGDIYFFETYIIA